MPWKKNLEHHVPAFGRRLARPLLLQLRAVRESLGVRALFLLTAIADMRVKLLLVTKIFETARAVVFRILVNAVEMLLETTDIAQDAARASTIVQLIDVAMAVSVEVHFRVRTSE